MTPRVRQYAAEAAEAHGVQVPEIFSRNRAAKVANARASIMVRLRGDGFTTVQIGRWLGRDHSTVIYNLRRYPQADPFAALGEINVTEA